MVAYDIIEMPIQRPIGDQARVEGWIGADMGWGHGGDKRERSERNRDKARVRLLHVGRWNVNLPDTESLFPQRLAQGPS